MATVKPLYNAQEKKAHPPIEVEGDGTWVLYSLDTDYNTKEVPTEIDMSFGVCYCLSTPDHNVLFTLSNRMWTTLCNHFLKKKDSSGKWVDDSDKQKHFEEIKELTNANKGRSIVYCAGHEGLEAIVKHYNGKWVKLDGQLLTKDANKVTTLLLGIDSGTIDEELVTQVTNGDIQPLLEYSDVPRAGLKGKPLPVLVDPETLEVLSKQELKDTNCLGIPLAVTKAQLPVVRMSNGYKRKSQSEIFIETLELVLEKTGAKNWDELRQLSLENPNLVRLVYATLGKGYGLSDKEFDASIQAEVFITTAKAQLEEEDE